MTRSRIDRHQNHTSRKVPLIVGSILFGIALLGAIFWYTEAKQAPESDVVTVPFDPTYLADDDLLEREARIVDQVDLERLYGYEEPLPTLVRDVTQDLEAYRETLLTPALDDPDAEAFRKQALEVTADTLVFYRDLHDYLMALPSRKPALDAVDPANMEARTRLLAESADVVQGD